MVISILHCNRVILSAAASALPKRGVSPRLIAESLPSLKRWKRYGNGPELRERQVLEREKKNPEISGLTLTEGTEVVSRL